MQKQPTRNEIKAVLMYAIELKKFIRSNNFSAWFSQSRLQRELIHIKKWLNQTNMHRHSDFRILEKTLYKFPPTK